MTNKQARRRHALHSLHRVQGFLKGNEALSWSEVRNHTMHACQRLNSPDFTDHPVVAAHAQYVLDFVEYSRQATMPGFMYSIEQLILILERDEGQ